MSDHDDFTTAIATSSRTLDDNYLSLESRGGAGGPLLNTLRKEAKDRGLRTDGNRSDLQQRILKSNNSASPVEEARYFTTVPEGIKPGMPIPVRVEGFSRTVICPEGLKAGDEFWFHSSEGECFAYSVRKPGWVLPGMQFPVNFGDGRKMMVQCPKQVREDGYIRFMTPEQKQLVEQKRQQQEQKRQQQQQMQEEAEAVGRGFSSILEEFKESMNQVRFKESMNQVRKQNEEAWNQQLEESREQSEKTITQSIKQKEEITKQPEESAMQYEESWNRDCSTTLFQENKTPQQGGATDTTERKHQISNQVHSPNSSDRKVLHTSITKENVDPQIVSEDVAPEAPAPTTTASASLTPAKPKSESTAGPELSAEEEKIAAKYRKMRKIGIPENTVRHDMKKENVSDKIVEAIFGKEDTSKTDNNMETPARAKDTKIKLRLQDANLRPELFEKSIFAGSATKKREQGTINPEEGDIKKLAELFTKKDNVNTGNVNSGQSNAGNRKANLLDITRANNVEIQLRAFNDFTLRALAETIDDLDPDSKIVGERVQFIPQLLPKPQELQAIKAYKGDSDRLVTAELFFQQLLPVKRFADKVEVMKTMCTLNEHAEEARAAFKTLTEVCGQITDSAKLATIVSFVLYIGNLMNEGSVDGGVQAFKFESLPKLTQTKSADGKTTVLDYIVETFIEKEERETLFLNSDFPDIQESCRLSINDLRGDVNTLRKKYQLCKTELDHMKKDQAPKPKSIPKKTNNEGEAADPRNALFAAIRSRGENNDDNSSKPPTPVDIKNKGATASNKTSVSTSNVKYSRGVKKLESFIGEAEETLYLIESEQDAAIKACKDLAMHCGEEGGERSASSLLRILSNFASALVAAVEKYDKRAEASKRQKAQHKSVPQKEKTDKENQVNTLPKQEPFSGMKSVDPRQELFAAIKSRRQG